MRHGGCAGGWLAIALAWALPATAGQRIGVANEGGIRDAWTLPPGAQLAVPQYPAAFVERGDTVCLGLGYLLNPDGTTSDFTLLKAWNSASGTSEPAPGYWSAFAEAAGDALKQWRFQPRPEVTQPKPVYTVATFVFGQKGTMASTRSHCTIPSLAHRLRELQGGRNRRVAGSEILERLDLGTVVDPNDPVYSDVR